MIAAANFGSIAASYRHRVNIYITEQPSRRNRRWKLTFHDADHFFRYVPPIYSRPDIHHLTLSFVFSSFFFRERSSPRSRVT